MEMRTDKRELDKIYKRRDRYEIPDWQREKVWDLSRKQLLIDSILRGWKLPKFYFVKNSDQGYDVVDGQQRLTAIFEFLGGELSLSPESADQFGGATYATLPPDISDLIDDFVIDFDEITDATDGDLMEFFQRLQSGLQLNSSEKLNAIQSKLRTFCKKSASHDFFKNKVAFNDKRYAHFDVVAKVAAIEIEGLGAGLRYDDVKTVFEANPSFSESSATAKRIRKALDFLDKATPAGSKVFRNRSVTQSFINLVCAFVDSGALVGKEQLFGKFAESFVAGLTAEVDKGHNATDADYLSFQKSINANVSSGPVTRHKVLLRKLFAYAPQLLDEVSAAVSGAADFSNEIAQSAAEIRTLIADINDVHSAAHGKDLFKPTNKTAVAQAAIGDVSKSQNAYKDLVDNLYFLLWEGPGGKLEQQPESFKDVNTLRTDLQHDVDHGGATKFKAKKLAHGAVFEKYAGIKSPAAAGPERFPLAQHKLLRAVEGDLRTLLASYD
jgi:hypothetical protein